MMTATASSVSSAWAHYITVTVLDPLVGPDPRGTGEHPPHVYRFGHPPEFPALCLFDPRDDEWGPDQLIADTIVP